MQGQKGRDELIEAIAVCDVLAHENPCRMKDFSLGLLAKAVKTMVGKEYTKGMNQRAVGKYFGVDARTIQRWARKYPDFPVGRHDGDKEVSYDPLDVVAFKRRHKELFS